MIIPVTFVAPYGPTSARPQLPPALARISHTELVLLELQGALDVDFVAPTERDGRLVGRLSIDAARKNATLTIGHHLLEGRVASLPKPLAVLQRVAPPDTDLDPDADADAMDCDLDDSVTQARTQTQMADAETSPVSWDAIALIKQKIIFSKRPMPIVGRQT
ncbi:Ctf8-domain-containing protein [Mycena pura]|uniref:Ctf8-domain-containing protein n=1 Tax=Mycena pura TaxID=153505 RepID=A0AAD6Y4N5_9AGAR|nr:Ctf8-domain-containing protein [Mycena pura]